MAISSSSWPGERLFPTRRVDDAPGVGWESLRPANDRTSLLAVDIMTLTAKTFKEDEGDCWQWKAFARNRTQEERNSNIGSLLGEKTFFMRRRPHPRRLCGIEIYYFSMLFHNHFTDSLRGLLVLCSARSLPLSLSPWCSRWTTTKNISFSI